MREDMRRAAQRDLIAAVSEVRALADMLLAHDLDGIGEHKLAEKFRGFADRLLRTIP